ncbi:MAG: hypothetical protein PF689_06185 [Deltaproteobacteria bacterium]|nr:hypothetical protein [Deltaproteobacteria bacterium]
MFWIADSNQDKKIQPDEVVELKFYDTSRQWVQKGEFTKAFREAYKKIMAYKQGKFVKGLSKNEKKRRKLVVKELSQGRPTLVFNDFRSLSSSEKKFISKMYEISKLIDHLHRKQLGVDKVESKIAKNDPASRRMFRRNWGPECKAPKTESKELCRATSPKIEVFKGVYPEKLQKGDKERKFCKKLAKLDKNRKNTEKLLYQFNVVQDNKGKLEPVPYTEAWKETTSKISSLLIEAVALLGDDEKALKAYLTATARSFKDNNWYEADKKWAAMNAKNSKYYLRIGPDEVYWDPCNRKAGFHFTFSLINKASLQWQQKMEPVKQKMEDNLAQLIGKPYKARKIGLQLPDFINIISNAGNDRHPLGATIGQSLPNWGPVATKGGRTVVMTNLYTDPDSLKIGKAKAESLFSKESMKHYTKDQLPGLISIILHEVSHNMGPSHEYKVKGKTDVDIFGGALATTLEELKAQTGALWYTKLLLDEKIIEQKLAYQSWLHSIYWAFGHISKGMYKPNNKPRPYSQLAAIQIGFLMDKGVVQFKPELKAANGKDKGAFVVHLDKFPGVLDELMKLAGQIKAAGQKTEAENLIKKYVDSDKVPQALIKERVQRYSKASFVYGWKI